MKKAYIVWGIVAVVLLIAIWYLFAERRHNRDESNAGLANPASVYCSQTLGGQLDMVTEDAGQVGYCHLPDGRVCEEWALFRGEACTAPGRTATTTSSAPVATSTANIQPR